MDEARRCDSLAYLAYGNLLVHGTPAEIAGDSTLEEVFIRLMENCPDNYSP